MKLNKVLALALSGVMAVSMLAGCSGNSGNGDQNGEGETSTGSLAERVIAALDSKTADKVSFAASMALETTLKQAIQCVGTDETDESVIVNKMAEIDSELVTYPKIKAIGTDNTDNDSEDKETSVTEVMYFDEAATNATYIVNQLAKKIDNAAVYDNTKGTCADLPEKSNIYKDGTTDYRYEFKYTGDVAVVEVTNSETGHTSYFVAITVTRTPTKVEL